jgi:gliding motility-associated-like protein
VDSFGVRRGDEVFYETVHVKAEFEMWFVDRSDPEKEDEWIQSENPEEEAPMEVRFINISENGVEFEWTLVDSAKTGEESEFTTYAVEDSVVFTYYIPGYYYPGMIAYSEAGCIDSFPVATNPEIHVKPSELDAPNVFTPNGDGVNDFFVVRSQSLKAFRVTIYSQSGRRVYEYVHREGRFEWEGWDGTLDGKGKTFVSPGVYYYVIDALGWDGVPYRNSEPFTGFVYLFRENE